MAWVGSSVPVAAGDVPDGGDDTALLPSGGCFGFSLNDHALEDGSYKDAIAKLADDGVAATVFEEYGDHLPGIGLNSLICVLRKR